MWQVRKSLLLLRSDAIERGMLDLAILYGWSAIRIGVEELAAIEARIKSNPA